MSKKHVLLVDNEESVLGVMKAMLEHLDFNVVEARNGQEALDKFQEQKDDFSLVILDYKMPEMDGLQCLKRIREIAETPVIISSGLGANISEEILGESQAQGVLPKPFTISDVQKTITQVLKDNGV